MHFAPRQSWFVVFCQPKTASAQSTGENFPKFVELATLAGPWEVAFDPKWGGPERVTFEHLDDWTTRPEDGIPYYSGMGTYRLSFDASRLPPQASRLFLDLGTVKNLAHVRLNNQDLGVVWTAPWRVEMTGALKSGPNNLEVVVANLWPNRLIGDARLPREKRFTVTNVRTYDTMAGDTYGCIQCEERKKSGKAVALLSSGLLGPVRVMGFEQAERDLVK
jgi:hypothetical protein